MPTKPKTFRPANYTRAREPRGSARERGYSTAWDKLSKYWRATHPYCVRCKAESGVLVPVQVVDHIKPVKFFPGLALDADNLQSLCKRHNKIKATEDERRWGPGGV